MSATCKPTIVTWADPSIVWIADHIRASWLTPIVHFFSSLGETGAILLVVSLGYWLWNKRALKYIAYGTFATILVNVWVKGLFLQCRPPASFWLDHAKDLGKSYSFPSGHAQVSILFWVGLAYFVRSKWLSPLLIMVGLLVGLSRPYLGVHYPHDVLGGWVVGSVVLAILIFFEKKEYELFKDYSLWIQTLILFLFFILCYLLIKDPTSLVLRTSFVFFGFWLGSQWEKRYVHYQPSKRFFLNVALSIFGFIGVLLLWKGGRHLLEGISGSAFQLGSLMAIQYAIIGLWISFLMPFIMKRLSTVFGDKACV